MKIIINSSSMVPIYEQIVDQVKAQIISGELKEDDNLPSVRTLSKELSSKEKHHNHLANRALFHTLSFPISRPPRKPVFR